MTQTPEQKAQGRLSSEPTASQVERWREEFEQWFVENAFDYVRDPIGSKLCGDQWKAYLAGREAQQREGAETLKGRDAMLGRYLETVEKQCAAMQRNEATIAQLQAQVKELEADMDAATHGEIPDGDSPLYLVHQHGAEFAVSQMAKLLGVSQWDCDGGTDTYEGDLCASIHNLLSVAAGCPREDYKVVPLEAAQLSARRDEVSQNAEANAEIAEGAIRWLTHPERYGNDLDFSEGLDVEDLLNEHERQLQAQVKELEARLAAGEAVAWRFRHVNYVNWSLSFYEQPDREGQEQQPLYLAPPAQQPAAQVPDGWQLVPIEPTTEQWDAGNKASTEHGVIAIYKAMLSTAPTHKESK